MENCYITFLEWWEQDQTHVILGFINKEKIWVILDKNNPSQSLQKNVSEALLAIDKGYVKI